MENRCVCCGAIIPEGRQVCRDNRLAPSSRAIQPEKERRS